MPMNKRCSPTSISDLPDGILVEIIARAPVKSIVLCKCVSKTWFDLISDPSFAKLQLQRSLSNRVTVISSSTTQSEEVYQFDLLSDPSFAKLQFQRPLSKKTTVISSSVTHSEEIYRFDREEDVCLEQFHRPLNNTVPYGSCNGLLLLYYRNVKLLLCNPIILKNLLVLPPVSFDRYNSLGIGFSNVSNKYKVVQFNRNQTKVCVVGGHGMSWRCVTSHYKDLDGDGVGDGDGDTIDSAGTYAHGALHWWRHGSNTTPYSILCFDIETEQFGIVSPPRDDFGKISVRVGVLGGCLAAIYLRDAKCSIWVMKQYGVQESWTKEINVVTSRFGLLTPMLKLKNGDVLFFDYKHVLTYDSKRKIIKQKRRFKYCPHHHPYVPSLLSPKHL